VLEGYTTEEQRFVLRLLWGKELSAKNIHKEMFPVCCWECFSRKAVHSWVEKSGKRFADDEEVETEMRKWLRRQTKYFCVTGVDAGKTMGQLYQCLFTIC
jgi:hypothetical protein